MLIQYLTLHHICSWFVQIKYCLRKRLLRNVRKRRIIRRFEDKYMIFVIIQYVLNHKSNLNIFCKHGLPL